MPLREALNQRDKNPENIFYLLVFFHPFLICTRADFFSSFFKVSCKKKKAKKICS